MTEVGVVGVDLSLILHRNGGDVRVGNQICADPGSVEIPAQIRQVVYSRVDRRNAAITEPLQNSINRLGGVRRMCEHRRVRHHPYKPGRHDPGDADSFRAVDQAFPPTSGGVVLRDAIVVGINQ